MDVATVVGERDSVINLGAHLMQSCVEATLSVLSLQTQLAVIEAVRS